MLASCKIALLMAGLSCAIDFQTESVLALNKKLKFPIHFFWISSPYAAVLGYKNGSAIDQTTL